MDGCYGHLVNGQQHAARRAPRQRPLGHPTAAIAPHTWANDAVAKAAEAHVLLAAPLEAQQLGQLLRAQPGARAASARHQHHVRLLTTCTHAGAAHMACIHACKGRLGGLPTEPDMQCTTRGMRANRMCNTHCAHTRQVRHAYQSIIAHRVRSTTIH